MIVALVIGRTRIRATRNRSGRWHLYWLDKDGFAWEFYTKGASRCSYLRNAVRIGEIRRMPSRDQAVLPAMGLFG